MGGVGEGAAAAEAEAVVLIGIVVMRNGPSGPMVGAVLVEGMMTETTVTMKEAEGQGAEVQCARAEAEAQEGGGIEVLLEKAVLKEGLRLSNGTGRRSRPNLAIRLRIPTIMALSIMGVNIVILSSDALNAMTGSVRVVLVCLYALS